MDKEKQIVRKLEKIRLVFIYIWIGVMLFLGALYLLPDMLRILAKE